MGCDLCGKEGELVRARIEGTVLTVCASCRGHGEIIEEQRPVRRRQRPVESRREVLELVRQGCGATIKRAREERGLKQEQLAKQLRIKESLLHAYESGSHIPDLETARRLERALGINIVETHVEEHEAAAPSAEEGGALTIGDLIKRR